MSKNHPKSKSRVLPPRIFIQLSQLVPEQLQLVRQLLDQDGGRRSGRLPLAWHPVPEGAAEDWGQEDTERALGLSNELANLSKLFKYDS